MKETLKMALEALENIDKAMPFPVGKQAITALRTALAQPAQEPVAWGVFEGNLHDMFFSQEEAQEMADLKGTHAEVRPLYTTPAQCTWVGLTDEELSDIYNQTDWDINTNWDYERAIEAKLKEQK